MKKAIISLAACIVGIVATSPTFAGGNVSTIATTNGFIVTQFAVPVAVPQYVVPVAPASHVQYGGAAPLAINEALEDRIVAKVLKGLQGSPTFKAQTSAETPVTKTCVSCHNATSPKGGLSLADMTALTAEQRLKCIARTLSDDPETRMPPASSGMKLSPEELGTLLHELSQSPEGR
jgi:mono/diheme cytochrome c family protein